MCDSPSYQAACSRIGHTQNRCKDWELGIWHRRKFLVQCQTEIFKGHSSSKLGWDTLEGKELPALKMYKQRPGELMSVSKCPSPPDSQGLLPSPLNQSLHWRAWTDSVFIGNYELGIGRRCFSISCQIGSKIFQP